MKAPQHVKRAEQLLQQWEDAYAAADPNAPADPNLLLAAQAHNALAQTIILAVPLLPQSQNRAALTDALEKIT